jgi:hypothetical protein
MCHQERTLPPQSSAACNALRLKGVALRKPHSRERRIPAEGCELYPFGIGTIQTG